MDEAEDFAALDNVARGTTWDAHFIAGEPNFAPFMCVLIWDRLTGVDSRTKLPRRCLIQPPVMFRPREDLPQRPPSAQRRSAAAATEAEAVNGSGQLS
jgi:hypothetical protein